MIRINGTIGTPEVLVIDQNGDKLGVLATSEALRLARERGLDLVEINPRAGPPVCKILDYRKYSYEAKVKLAEHRRKCAARKPEPPDETA